METNTDSVRYLVDKCPSELLAHIKAIGKSIISGKAFNIAVENQADTLSVPVELGQA
jgi:hypothetical protein